MSINDWDAFDRRIGRYMAGICHYCHEPYIHVAHSTIGPICFCVRCWRRLLKRELARQGRRGRGLDHELVALSAGNGDGWDALARAYNPHEQEEQADRDR